MDRFGIYSEERVTVLGHWLDTMCEGGMTFKFHASFIQVSYQRLEGNVLKC